MTDQAEPRRDSDGASRHDLRAALEAVLGVRASEGNRLTLLRNGEEIFPAMLDAIRDAERSIDLLTFIWWTGEVADQFTDALVDRARRGRRVRVILDAIGSRYADQRKLDRIRQAGGQVVAFRPVGVVGGLRHSRRTHRKILVCDGRIGFTGGVGIADQWAGNPSNGGWRETQVRVEGPAVDGLRGAFLANWAESGGDILDTTFDTFAPAQQPGSSPVAVVRGDAGAWWNDVTTMVRALLSLTKERFRFATAYFNPDSMTRELLAETSRRGVDVELLLPGVKADKRFAKLAGEAHFAPLLDAGVTIHWYEPSMMHCKVVTVDGLVASIGSANLNRRSMSIDDEVNLLVFDPDVVAALDADFDDDLRNAVQVRPVRWQDRSLPRRMLEIGTIPGSPFA